MTEFREFKSIENHYRAKHIRDMFKWNPLYIGAQYIATAKLDGANIQFHFERQLDRSITLKYGKRTSYLDEPFYGMTSVVERPKFEQFIEHVYEFIRMNEHINDIIFYGELFGKGIQNRIDYNLPDGKDIKFYDATINGEYCTQQDFFKLMDFIYSKSFCVPVVAWGTFDELMDIDVENLISAYNTDGENNHDEGIVIKPWNIIVKNKDNEQVLFYIKKKSDRFADKMKCKTRKLPKPVDPKLKLMMDEFESYLTENRLMDLFGKVGEIDDPNDIGKYIKLMVDDTKGDFMKDNMEPFLELNKKQQRTVFGIAGKVVVKMLQKYL